MKNTKGNVKDLFPAERKQINSAKEPLTVEKLRSFEGFANLSDKQAEEVVTSIRILAAVLYQYDQTEPLTEHNLKIAA